MFRYKYIFNYAFIAALLLLLINDHILKQAYGNWFTGKLSDFAGILVLPLFLKSILPVSNRAAIGSTVLFFLYWKSPLIQPLIDAFNAVSIYRIGRVVDYTDYISFIILPLAIYVMKNARALMIKSGHAKILAQVLVLPVCLLALVATSDEDDLIPTISDPSITNCCRYEPLESEVGNGKIFIPSAFTPDGNGINDFFQVSADSNILRIDNFVVFELFNFDTVYYGENITQIIPENGFDGVVNDTIVPATYYYLISATSRDSFTRWFEGEVCSFPCMMPIGLSRPAEISTCGFSTQHDFINGYNPNADSGEDLDCFD